MKKKYISLIFAFIFLTGFLIRVYPAMQNELPMRFDSYYHVRVANLMLEKGILTWEPWPEGGRPHNYPPGYHLLLLAAAPIFGGTMNATLFVLPIFSSLIIFASFWITRRLKDDITALLVSFFIAVNPYMVSTSYDSPQIIGIFLSLFGIYYLLNKKYLYTSALLALAFLFNPFSVAIVSLPILLYLLIEKDIKAILKTFSIPLALVGLWQFMHMASISCYNNWLGPHFIHMKVGTWVNFVTPIFVFMPFLALGLVDNFKEKYKRFWSIWVFSMAVVFLLHFITPVLHPWRIDLYLMLGVSFLMADSLSKLRWKELGMVALFAFVLLSSLYLVFFVSTLFMPPLTPNEYKMMDHIKEIDNPDFVPLANHDLCSNILTLTGKQCLIDINFECIPNQDKWYDYEQLYWMQSRVEMKDILNRNTEIKYMVYSSGDWGRDFLETMTVDKIYSAWLDYSQDAAIYKINRIGENVTYVVA